MALIFSTPVKNKLKLLKYYVMNKWTLQFVSAALLSLLSGCEIVGGIFKAGVWSGVFIVVLVLAFIIWLVSRLGKK